MKINGVDQGTIALSEAKTALGFAKDIMEHVGQGMGGGFTVMNMKQTREHGYAPGAKASVVAEEGNHAFCADHNDFHNDTSEYLLWHPIRHEDFWHEAVSGSLIAIYPQ